MNTKTKLILGGIVVTAIIAGVYFWNKKPKSKNTDENVNDTPNPASIKMNSRRFSPTPIKAVKKLELSKLREINS